MLCLLLPSTDLQDETSERQLDSLDQALRLCRIDSFYWRPPALPHGSFLGRLGVSLEICTRHCHNCGRILHWGRFHSVGDIRKPERASDADETIPQRSMGRKLDFSRTWSCTVLCSGHRVAEHGGNAVLRRGSFEWWLDCFVGGSGHRDWPTCVRSSCPTYRQDQGPSHCCICSGWAFLWM